MNAVADGFEHALRRIAAGETRNPQKYAEEVLATGDEGDLADGPPDGRRFTVTINDANAPDGETLTIMREVLGLAFGGEDVTVEAL